MWKLQHHFEEIPQLFRLHSKPGIHKLFTLTSLESHFLSDFFAILSFSFLIAHRLRGITRERKKKVVNEGKEWDVSAVLMIYLRLSLLPFEPAICFLAVECFLMKCKSRKYSACWSIAIFRVLTKKCNKMFEKNLKNSIFTLKKIYGFLITLKDAANALNGV